MKYKAAAAADTILPVRGRWAVKGGEGDGGGVEAGCARESLEAVS